MSAASAASAAYSPYRAPKWLPGGHAQTLYPLLIKPAPPPYRRERWETPDDDFIDLDWIDGKSEAPLLLLFHGLEGSSASHYAISLMAAIQARGWSGVVSHFRGCSGEANRLPRAYHSGDSNEVDWVLRRLRQQHPKRQIYAVGVSLGGNALLKWLGEREFLTGDVINAAAAVCAPLDLTICGHHLGRGFNKVYTQHFLQTLKRSAAEKLARFLACSTCSACGRRAASTNSTMWSPDRCTVISAPTITGNAPRPNRCCAVSASRLCCSTHRTILSCRRTHSPMRTRYRLK